MTITGPSFQLRVDHWTLSSIIQWPTTPETSPAPATTSAPATTPCAPAPSYLSPQPQSCWLPPPSKELSCPPAGRGLTKNADGSVTTAGGYRIKADGNAASWRVFDPNGKMLTRVWGDPHVQEKDGTKWDFTKNSNFVLPDGTRISANTVAGKNSKAKTITGSLDIANGNDRVQIRGVNTPNPRTGDITHDGLAGWQAKNAARDTFVLNHDDRKQDWIKLRKDGSAIGVVKGAVEQGGQYRQLTNQRLHKDVKDSFNTGFASPSWANQIETNLGAYAPSAWPQQDFSTSALVDMRQVLLAAWEEQMRSQLARYGTLRVG